MPVSGSDVMLTENKVPNGVLSARPPAKGFEASPVWQGAQSAARARYSPRETRAASSCDPCAWAFATNPNAASMAAVPAAARASPYPIIVSMAAAGSYRRAAAHRRDRVHQGRVGLEK